MTTKLYVPAGELAGLTLTSNGGRSWKVIELLSNSGILNATGGYFSKGYLVLDVDTHETGFLKALDFSSSLESPDPVGALFAQTNAYRFEVDLLNVCRTRRLDRVVVALDDGTYRSPNNPL